MGDEVYIGAAVIFARRLDPDFELSDKNFRCDAMAESIRNSPVIDGVNLRFLRYLNISRPSQRENPLFVTERDHRWFFDQWSQRCPRHSLPESARLPWSTASQNFKLLDVIARQEVDRNRKLHSNNDQIGLGVMLVDIGLTGLYAPLVGITMMSPPVAAAFVVAGVAISLMSVWDRYHNPLLQ